jgi:predicted GH43/DUF377 family glycosyl hydrolase
MGVHKEVMKRSSKGRDYSFARCSLDPFLSPAKGTFFEDSVTTADVLEFGNEVLLFFGGLCEHERIGLASVPREHFNGRAWTIWQPDPVLDIGPPGSFDCRHVTDPASICTESGILLYYSGLGEGEDAIGLAISEDGKAFFKFSENPLLEGRAPEIVWHQGQFYLYFVRPDARGGYSIFLANSVDGSHFSKPYKQPVLEPSIGMWDSYTVTTPRIYRAEDRFWLSYAGDDETRDFPKGFGLAFSKDLIHWEKYKGNPVLRRGLSGSWDDQAIWFPTLYRHRDRVLMLYEGSHNLSDLTEPVSQIGLAVLDL